MESVNLKSKPTYLRFGEIESVNLKVDPVNGRSRCFAFLVFKESSSVDKEINRSYCTIMSYLLMEADFRQNIIV